MRIYVQGVLPNPYPVEDLGKNVQYTSKTKDIQNKGEGGLMDRDASKPMAISEWTSTAFASLEATRFKSISTWPENILIIQNSGSMFQLVCIPSSFPAKKSSWPGRKQGEIFASPNGSGTFTQKTPNAQTSNMSRG